MRLSVIDDDPSVRNALSHLLEAFGYAVSLYPDAQTFLADPAGDRTDGILTDIEMPGLSGIELKRELDRRHWRVPVLMLTAKTDPLIWGRAQASAPAALLRKPIDAEQLMAAIERVLRR